MTLAKMKGAMIGLMGLVIANSLTAVAQTTATPVTAGDGPATASVSSPDNAPVRLVKVEVRYAEINTDRIPADLRPGPDHPGPNSAGLAAYLWSQLEQRARDVRLVASASAIAEDGHVASYDDLKWKAFAATANPTTQLSSSSTTRPTIVLTAEPYAEGVLLRIAPHIGQGNIVRARLEFSLTHLDGLEPLALAAVPDVIVQSSVPRSSNVSVQTSAMLLPQTPQILGEQTGGDTSRFVLARARVLSAR